MHELPVTEGILSVALKATAKNGNRRITAITLVIGDLSSIIDDSIQFYFDILSKDTLAEGAKLLFQREPAIATCLACSYQVEVRAPLDPFCPQCQSPLLQVKGGKEFYVESIEVEDDENSSRSTNSHRKRSGCRGK